MELTEALKYAEEFHDDLTEDLVNYIVDSNEEDYNITKLVEELNELATVLTQYINKKGGPKQPTIKSIVEEIGDVVMRLGFLSLPAAGMFQQGEFEKLTGERIDVKLGKYFKFVKEGKYVGRI